MIRLLIPCKNCLQALPGFSDKFYIRVIGLLVARTLGEDDEEEENEKEYTEENSNREAN